jgi:hypothetical protein
LEGAGEFAAPASGLLAGICFGPLAAGLVLVFFALLFFIAVLH